MIYFMKNVRLRTFFPDFALLVKGVKNDFKNFSLIGKTGIAEGEKNTREKQKYFRRNEIAKIFNEESS